MSHDREMGRCEERVGYAGESDGGKEGVEGSDTRRWRMREHGVKRKGDDERMFGRW